MTEAASLRQDAAPLLAEIADVFERMEPDALDPLQAELLRARKIVLYGQGRTGLVMQALAMRLHHLGHDAHVVGAITTPPVGSGDLFLVNAASGDLPTGLALMRSALAASARVALITALPDSPAGREAHLVLCLPVQTMAASPSLASAMPLGRPQRTARSAGSRRSEASSTSPRARRSSEHRPALKDRLARNDLAAPALVAVIAEWAK